MTIIRSEAPTDKQAALEQQMPKEMQEALEKRDLAALQRAMANARAAENLGFLGGARGAFRRFWTAASWTRSLKNNSQTPIGVAIEQRWLEGLAVLAPHFSMRKWCDLAKGCGPLDLCVEFFWAEGLPVLIDKAPQMVKQNALARACALRSAECAELLLRRGAMAEPTENYKFKPPIIAAVLSGSLECVKALTMLGASPWSDGFEIEVHGEQVRMSSPFMLAISGENPSWDIAHHFLDLGAPQRIGGRREVPHDELNRHPLMVILNSPRLLESALAFKKDGMDGESLLWRLSEDVLVDHRDKNGLGWSGYAHREEPNQAAMEFKRRLIENMGLKWRFSTPIASQVKEAFADIHAEPALAMDEKLVAARNAAAEPAAVEQCLAAMATMTTAMAAMAAAMGRLAAEAHDRDGVGTQAEATEQLEKKALSLMEKAVEMREQIAEIAGAPSGDRRVGRP